MMSVVLIADDQQDVGNPRFDPGHAGLLAGA
jgi:hypothetical protein